MDDGWLYADCKVSKGAKIRNRYNQAPYLTQFKRRKTKFQTVYPTKYLPN